MPTAKDLLKDISDMSDIFKPYTAGIKRSTLENSNTQSTPIKIKKEELGRYSNGREEKPLISKNTPQVPLG